MGKEKTVCEEEFEKWWVGNKFEDPSDGLTSKMLIRQNIRSVGHFAWNSAWSTCGRLVVKYPEDMETQSDLP